MTQTDSYIIKDRKVLKEIVDITRQKIVRQLYDKPLTAEDIAITINFPQEKIYYHLKKLEAAGIIQSEHAGVVNGINQKHYLNVAKNIIVKMDMLKPSSDQEDKKLIQNVLSEDHIEVMSLVDHIIGYNDEPIKPVLRSKTFNVSEKKYREIAAQLKEIQDRLEAAEKEEQEVDTVSVHMDIKYFMFESSSKKN
jgi:DNA-binding transcriptional ArsR family regulator|tara:strand:+ start:2196 stop:2777 length:582 start_codon:yes stop_codon:yes gene_type:complete